MGQYNFDKYGFFNGIFGIEQANWAEYWKGVIPDGVVANSGALVNGHHELEVYYAGGMQVYVAPGEVMVDNHKAWLDVRRTLLIAESDSTDDRIDTVVVRVIYGNEGESVVELDVKTGTASQTPTAPSLTQQTGNIYEYALANILVNAGTGSIDSTRITDQRYVFSMSSGSITPFTEEEYHDENERVARRCQLTVLDGREYRASDIIYNNIEVILPSNPNSTFMCEIVYTTGTKSVTETVLGTEVVTEFSYNGIVFKRNGSTYDVKCSNMIVTAGARYNILIWWDGMFFWADCKAVVA